MSVFFLKQGNSLYQEIERAGLAYANGETFNYIERAAQIIAGEFNQTFMYTLHRIETYGDNLKRQNAASGES
jgi:hypothetical protein